MKSMMLLLLEISRYFPQVLALGSFSKAWRFSGSSDFPILVRGELILAAWRGFSHDDFGRLFGHSKGDQPWDQ